MVRHRFGAGIRILPVTVAFRWAGSSLSLKSGDTASSQASEPLTLLRRSRKPPSFSPVWVGLADGTSIVQLSAVARRLTWPVGPV
ncbi:hypothetical protein CALVIDRAFT_533474 [Calocera viscosa TUFC12733]|uniref:Uncharacterized protein n=1 Tax=Calocera viscosa (strain TUFC12733) TaxID=1330018 RepID=A0A167R1U2_CALVF|nr:hypothetical protein CALVIDRAFT_533474 [Calocera viscosa TUFC12733]